MALARTDFGPYPSNDSTGANAFVTPSFTPTASSLVVVLVSAFGNDGGVTPPIADDITCTQSGGLTVTKRLQGGEDSNWPVASCFFSYEVGSSPGSQTLTVDCGANNIRDYKVEVYCYTGYNSSSPFGATATGTGTYNGAKTITLDAAPAADSEVLAVVAGGANTVSSSVAPGTGWTEITDTEISGWAFFQTQSRTGSTSTSVTWNDIDVVGGGAGKFAASYAALEIKADAGGGSSATAEPSQGTLTLSGLAPTTNAFTNVRIREVLINEAGSPVGNQTGMHLIVWYGGAPSGSPDLSYSDMTTDANGTTSWSIATGSLQYNQGIFFVAHDGHTSMSVYTCARMVPTYS